jgi:hypothetical protein
VNGYPNTGVNGYPNTGVNGYPYYARDLAAENLQRSLYRAQGAPPDNVVDPRHVLYHCKSSEDVMWEHGV